MSIEENEVVDVKFNVDIMLSKDEDEDFYRPLNFTEKAFKDPKSQHPLSRNQLFTRDEGFQFWKLGLLFQSDNIVRAGNVIKMKLSDAKQYLEAWVQKNGHRDPNVFTTYPTDPNLYKGYPVAELIK